MNTYFNSNSFLNLEYNLTRCIYIYIYIKRGRDEKRNFYLVYLVRILWTLRLLRHCYFLYTNKQTNKQANTINYASCLTELDRMAIIFRFILSRLSFPCDIFINLLKVLPNSTLLHCKIFSLLHKISSCRFYYPLLKSIFLYSFYLSTNERQTVYFYKTYLSIFLTAKSLFACFL